MQALGCILFFDDALFQIFLVRYWEPGRITRYAPSLQALSPLLSSPCWRANYHLLRLFNKHPKSDPSVDLLRLSMRVRVWGVMCVMCVFV